MDLVLAIEGADLCCEECSVTFLVVQEGKTALINAARDGDAGYVEGLLKLGAHVNVQGLVSLYGWCLLFMLAFACLVLCVLVHE